MKKNGIVIAIVGTLSMFSALTVSAGPSVTAKENLETLIKTRSCQGCDLSGLNFNRMDLSAVNLEGADLSLSTFFLTNLAGANLQDSKLNGAKFGGADLGDSDLRGADLRGASIESAYLGGAQLTGEMVTTKPYESVGVEDVEKEVYREDQTLSKKTDGPGEVKVGKRRDLGEAPPSIEQPVAEKTVTVAEHPVKIYRPQAPMEKKVSPVKDVVIVEEIPEIAEPEKVVNTSERIPVKVATPVVVSKEESSKMSNPKSTSANVVETKKTTGISEKISSVSPLPNSAQKLAMSKSKRDNMSKLLDKNRCYGCDLSGLDFSGENLDGADLEKANLSNCNLSKADLEGANLKGANLRGALLVKADLDDADFYNADLRGADLTGAKQKKTMFDGAKLDGAKGIAAGPLMLGN